MKQVKRKATKPSTICSACRGLLMSSNINMTLTAVGNLFPAIPLAIVALNFRYTSLAGLMREITAQLEPGISDKSKMSVLLEELTVMRTRMVLVKYALFLCGVAFISNLFSLFAGYFSLNTVAPLGMAFTILSMAGGIGCFCIETVLSTKALNLHIAGVLTKTEPQRH